MANGRDGMMKIMIFGCGYSGTAIAKAALDEGATATGTARTPEKAACLAAQGIRGIVFDGTELGDDLRSALFETTHLVQSIPPGPSADPLLKLVSGRLRELCPQLQWVGYLSTVGVYGDAAGGWVDEDTPCNPKPGRSQERVDAEAAWLAEGKAEQVPVAVLRLAGIYGPGRNAFVNLARGTARRIIKKDQVFNRIRVEDIAGASLFLARRKLGGLFNITDDEPGPAQDVITEAARLMGVEPPLEQPFESAEMTPMARTFYGANKRVSNLAIRRKGYVFHYPEQRMSLQQLWETGQWRGESTSTPSDEKFIQNPNSGQK